MPKIKNNASGQISDVDQTTIDQIKANSNLSQNYTFFRDEEVAPTPPEAQEGTVKRDEGQGQASPISAPQQQEQAPQQEGAKATGKATGKNSNK